MRIEKINSCQDCPFNYDGIGCTAEEEGGPAYPVECWSTGKDAIHPECPIAKGVAFEVNRDNIVEFE